MVDASNGLRSVSTARLLAIIDRNATAERAQSSVAGDEWEETIRKVYTPQGPPTPETWAKPADPWRGSAATATASPSSGWSGLDDAARDYVSSLMAPVTALPDEVARRAAAAQAALERLPGLWADAFAQGNQGFADAISAWAERAGGVLKQFAGDLNAAFRALFGAPPFFFWIVGLVVIGTLILVPAIGSFALVGWSPSGVAVGRGAGGALVGVGRGAGQAIASSGKLAAVVGA